MCGRFTLRARIKEIAEFLRLMADFELTPRYNIAPTQQILAARLNEQNKERELATLHWGLVPSWSKDGKGSDGPINARSETVAEKPTFRSPFKRRRCLVPADGFYEWQKLGKQKQPMHIHRPGGELFAIAAIWDRWERDGKVLESCALLTTSANKMMGAIHDRMPVILSKLDFDAWLDPAQTADSLKPLMVPCDDSLLIADPISTWVNSPTHEGPRCLQPDA